MVDFSTIAGGRAIVKVIRCAKGHASYYVSTNSEPGLVMSTYNDRCPHEADGAYPIDQVPPCGEPIVDWEMARAQVVNS